MYCPLHDDAKRSATLDLDNGLWCCHAGCGGGSVRDLVRDRSRWVPADGRVNDQARPSRRRADAPAPTEAAVEGYHQSLLSNEGALSELLATRGIWELTVKEYRLGWDSGVRAYTIPVYDKKGKLKNIRWWTPRPQGSRRKIWGIRGHNDPLLYPLSSLKAKEIVICEGELDALITTQHGFPAITRTASALQWKREWGKLFKGKTVYLVHDCDNAGRSANNKVGRSLSRYAPDADIRVVKLPYPVRKKNGKDLTDWWLEHEEDAAGFRRLLEEAEPFDPKKQAASADVVDADVIDAFDSSNVGKPLRVTVTVKGRQEPGYSIPRQVKYRCDQSMGSKCEICPMKKVYDGEHQLTLASSNPDVLAMIGSPDATVDKSLRAMCGIPTCPALQIDREQNQAVEILFTRPAIEASNGNAADYKNLRIVSVGRHDTPPNNTVQVVGSLQWDPKSQANTFLAWDITRTETGIDHFEITDKAIKSLRKFQADEKPLKKAAEIAGVMSRSVTRIYGRPEMHVLMDLVFHSALQFNFEGKVTRGWLDALVVGDTRTGKSEAARSLVRHYGAAEVISCESASFAGIVGGLQQVGGNREWVITWGTIPINDRRMVVLDEAGGLDVDEIAQLSDVRSSGQVVLTKVQQERTYARTRLLWLANPRAGGKLADYTYGAQAIRPLIGNPEDVARFDIAMSVSSDDVSFRKMNRPASEGRMPYTHDDCQLLIRWAWSRTPDKIVFAPGAEDTIRYWAGKLAQSYVEDPPLIQGANVREKIARLAVALAIRTFSCDSTGELVMVTKAHVKDAVKFMDRVYNLESFGYAEHSRQVLAERNQAVKSREATAKFLRQHKELARFMKGQSSFRRQDVEEIEGVDMDEANAIVNTLWNFRMIHKVRGDIKVQPALNRLLREAKL